MIPLKQHALTRAKRNLDNARREGDKLKIALAENALNNLIDVYNQTNKTSETGTK